MIHFDVIQELCGFWCCCALWGNFPVSYLFTSRLATPPLISSWRRRHAWSTNCMKVTEATLSLKSQSCNMVYYCLRWTWLANITFCWQKYGCQLLGWKLLVWNLFQFSLLLMKYFVSELWGGVCAYFFCSFIKFQGEDFIAISFSIIMGISFILW